MLNVNALSFYDLVVVMHSVELFHILFSLFLFPGLVVFRRVELWHDIPGLFPGLLRRAVLLFPQRRCEYLEVNVF